MIQTKTATQETEIWTRLMDPENPDLCPEAAKFFLNLDFPAWDKARMKKLAARAREGILNPVEQEEIDIFGRVGSLLSILKSKARVSLKKTSRSNGTKSNPE